MRGLLSVSLDKLQCDYMMTVKQIYYVRRFYNYEQPITLGRRISIVRTHYSNSSRCAIRQCRCRIQTIILLVMRIICSIRFRSCMGGHFHHAMVSAEGR